jgi:hypothetical protein
VAESNAEISLKVAFALKDIPQQGFRTVMERFPGSRSGANPSSLLPYISFDLNVPEDYERVKQFMAETVENAGIPHVIVMADTAKSWGEFQVPESAVELARELGVGVQVLFMTPAMRL